jgi:hypothetical protein
MAVLGLIGGGFIRVGAQESARRDQGAEVTYDVSQPMRVSLNLYDGQGQIVRSLLCGAPRQKGTQREFWDGRNQAGQPVPPGDYDWKVLAMPGRLKTEHLLTVGTNYPDPSPDPLQEAEHYRLVAPGTHGGPTAVAADESGIYIGAGCTENIENYLVKLSPDGKRRLWSKASACNGRRRAAPGPVPSRLSRSASYTHKSPEGCLPEAGFPRGMFRCRQQQCQQEEETRKN